MIGCAYQASMSTSAINMNKVEKRSHHVMFEDPRSIWIGCGMALDYSWAKRSQFCCPASHSLPRPLSDHLKEKSQEDSSSESKEESFV